MTKHLLIRNIDSEFTRRPRRISYRRRPNEYAARLGQLLLHGIDVKRAAHNTVPSIAKTRA